MRRTKGFVVGSLIGLSACTPILLAPGAAEVRVTIVSGDVAGCTPVGNLRVPLLQSGMVDPRHALGQLKNETIVLRGNVAFVTEGTPDIPSAGVAYHCASQPGPAQ